MANSIEHNKVCKEQGYDANICASVNRWMDEPSSLFPGCQHRNFRHSKNDCDFLANNIFLKTKDIDKAEKIRKICMLHRIVDRKSDGCGCKPLFEDYNPLSDF